MKTSPLPKQIDKRLSAVLAAGISDSTQRAYAGDSRYLSAWHQARYGAPLALPVSVNRVKTFVIDHLDGPPAAIDKTLLSAQAKRQPGPITLPTLKRRLATLSVLHSEAGLPNPCTDSGVKLLLRRAMRTHASAPRRKQAATADVVAALLATCDARLHGRRDAAIIAVGFSSGGRRRSELAGLRMEHLQKTAQGYLWRIAKSKTDQTGRGHTVPITGQAATLLRAWLVISGIRDGYVFRGILGQDKLQETFAGQGIARMIRRRAEQAGLDAEQFGGHSLRSGFITEGGRKDMFIGGLMTLSGHRSVIVALEYYRAGNATLVLKEDIMQS